MKIIFTFFFLAIQSYSQTFNIPERKTTAATGSEWAQKVMLLSRVEREDKAYNQIINYGNTPNFLRNPVKIKFEKSIGNISYIVEYFVLPDYLAIGSDSDYFLIPTTPMLAQKLANCFRATPPTRKMVNEIYRESKLKLSPQPIPPSAEMITMKVFKEHNDSVWSLRKNNLRDYPLGVLVGGTKKDVVISNNIYKNLKTNVPKPVVIYGWHKNIEEPIQPIYNGHGENYADYSHGIRFVSDTVIVNGEKKLLKKILQNEVLWELFSDEGKIDKPFYTVE